MYFSASVPAVTVQRSLDVEVAAGARQAHPERPSWTALFAKAYAIVAAEFPQLRQTYLTWPWPHLHEHETSIASVVVERSFGSEPGLVMVRVKDPARLTLVEISRLIRRGKSDEFIATRNFRVQCLVARLPLLLRRAVWWMTLNIPRTRTSFLGTFGLTTVAARGAEIVHPRSPLTTMISYGPLDATGKVIVRITFDHRVMDAMILADALERLQQVLNGPIVDELSDRRDVIVAPSLAPAFAHQPVE